MDKFLEKHNLSKLTYEEIGNINSAMLIKVIKSVIVNTRDFFVHKL